MVRLAIVFVAFATLFGLYEGKLDSTRASRMHPIRAQSGQGLKFYERDSSLPSSDRQLQPFSVLFDATGPLQGYDRYDEIFVINITVGTPPQYFNATISFEESWLFFFEAGSPTDVCYHGLTKSRNWYNPSASSTYKNITNSPNSPPPNEGFAFDPPFVPTGDCGGQLGNNPPPLYANDLVQIGVNNISFNFPLITNAKGVLSQYWPSDAILGLAYPLTDISYDSGAQIFDNLPAKAMTIYTASERKGGQMTFGGKDDTNCGTKWNYMRMATGYLPGMVIKSFTFGSIHTTPLMSIFTSKSSFIYVPALILQQIVAAVNAEYDFGSDLYVTDCTQIANQPDFVFQLDGFKYNLPAKDYLRSLETNKNEECTLMVLDLSQQDLGTDHGWVLGFTFLRPNCFLIDYDNSRVGFAKKKN
jgi:hypothetical protein